MWNARVSRTLDGFPKSREIDRRRIIIVCWINFSWFILYVNNESFQATTGSGLQGCNSGSFWVSLEFATELDGEFDEFGLAVGSGVRAAHWVV